MIKINLGCCLKKIGLGRKLLGLGFGPLNEGRFCWGNRFSSRLIEK